MRALALEYADWKSIPANVDRLAPVAALATQINRTRNSSTSSFGARVRDVEKAQSRAYSTAFRASIQDSTNSSEVAVALRGGETNLEDIVLEQTLRDAAISKKTLAQAATHGNKLLRLVRLYKSFLRKEQVKTVEAWLQANASGLRDALLHHAPHLANVSAHLAVMPAKCGLQISMHRPKVLCIFTKFQ